MKKNILILMGAMLIWGLSTAQQISPYLYGQNAWLLPRDGGTLNDLWQKIKVGGIKVVRIGGIGPDENMLTDEEYLQLVDSIKGIGAEPIIQISRKATPQIATDLITYLNDIHGRNVKFWSIGNEPDWHWHNSTDPSSEWYIRGGTDGAHDIAAYFKPVATALKAHDNTIKIFGPECAWYNGEYLRGLLGGPADITGTDENGNYYLDVATYHSYNKPNASDVENNILSLTSLVNTANESRPDDHKLDWAITEFHITTDNNKETDRHTTWSFYTGQYWAEVYAHAMKYEAFAITPWSIYESGGKRISSDLGVFDAGPEYKPRSTYFHEQMLSNFFNGIYTEPTDNVSDVKCIASVDDDIISLMVLNQSETEGYNMKIQLTEDAITTDEDLKINVSAGVDSSYTQFLPEETTILYVFDKSGNIQDKILYSKYMADNQLEPINLSTVDTVIVAINIDNKKPCLDEEINISAYIFGDVESLNWTLGDNASTAAATGEGPHKISYSEVGEKEIVLTIETLTKTYSVESGVTVRSCVQSPYNGNTQVIPGIIESVYYDEGGEGVSYHDTSEGNSGEGTTNEGIILEEDVDTEAGDVNGNIGWTEAGEWLEYTVNITEGANYKLIAHCASQDGGGEFKLYVDDIVVANSIKVASTGGWTSYSDVVFDGITLDVKDGAILKLEIVKSGFNVGQLIFEKSTDVDGKEAENLINLFPNPVNDVLYVNLAKEHTGNVEIKNLAGATVLKSNLHKQNSIDVSELEKGIYLLTVQNADKYLAKRFVVK